MYFGIVRTFVDVTMYLGMAIIIIIIFYKKMHAGDKLKMNLNY
jgi:hypothetical protein